MLNNNVKTTIEEIKSDHSNSGVDVNVGTWTPLYIDHVLEAVKCLGENRGYVIKTILAVFLSTFLEKKDPVWLMIVGNPSSNKTTLVDLLSPLLDVFKLDTMTSNPFSSGQREKEKPKDLLPLLDNKCFIIKEYGTIFGRSDEMVKQLISDFVAIYDGNYDKHSPTRGTVRYKTYFSHIGCVTPMSLSTRQHYMSAVGARFLFLRVDPLSEEEKRNSLNEVWEGKAKLKKEEISKIVCDYCLQLKEEALKEGEIIFSPETKEKINNLANLTARARGIVISEQSSFMKDGKPHNNTEVIDIQIEEPFRALKQLRKLAQCLAIVNQHNEVGDDEFEIMTRIVLSSMPVRRSDVLKAFSKKQMFTAGEAAKLLEKNYRTVKRNFDELVALKVLTSQKGINDKARVYKLGDEFLNIFSPPPIGAEDVTTLFNG